MSDVAIREDLGKIMVGIDLGQLRDYSAISVIRLIETTRAVTAAGNDTNRVYDAYDVFTEYRLIHLERFQLSYVEALDRLEAVIRHPDIQLDQKEIVMDASGLGQPVIEMAWGRGLEVSPIVITGGENPRYSDGKYFVPRTELISCLIAIFQSERIKIAGELELKKLLVDELSSLQLKKRPTGSESYETALTSQHDDMAISLAMPLWLTEQTRLQERVNLDTRERSRNVETDWANIGLEERNRW